MVINSDLSEALAHGNNISDHVVRLTDIPHISLAFNDNTAVQERSANTYARGKRTVSKYLTVGKRDSAHIKKIGIELKDLDQKTASLF